MNVKPKSKIKPEAVRSRAGQGKISEVTSLWFSISKMNVKPKGKIKPEAARSRAGQGMN